MKVLDIKTPKRYVIEITPRELQLLHAGVMWLDASLVDFLPGYVEKCSAIDDLWGQLDFLREAENIRVLPL